MTETDADTAAKRSSSAERVFYGYQLDSNQRPGTINKEYRDRQTKQDY